MLELNSKLQMAVALTLVATAALFFNPSLDSLLTLVLAVSFTAAIDLVLVRVRGVEFFLPSAAIVTGLIIGLIYQPNPNPLELLAVAGIAMASKNFLRSGRHPLNPAALGVLVGGLIFSNSPSWWGVSFYQPGIWMCILLIPVVVSMVLMKRYKITLSFLALYLVTSLFQSQWNLEVVPMLLLDPTVLFFSTVMLPEPMTSPHSSRNQILYGGVVALGILIIGLLRFQIDPLVLVLLVGNLIFFKLR